MRVVYLLLLALLLIPVVQSSCLPIPVVQVFIPEYIDPPAPGGTPALSVSSAPTLTLVEGEETSLILSVSGPLGEEVSVEALSSPPVTVSVSPELLVLGESPSEVSLIVSLPPESLDSPTRRDVRVIFSLDGEPRAEVVIPITLLRSPRISADLACPERAVAGTSIDLEVRVSNDGDVPAEDVSVLLRVGGRVSPNGPLQVDLDVPPRAVSGAIFPLRVDGPGSVEIVVRSGDVELVRSLKISAVAPNLSLSAQPSDGGVMLTIANSGNATAPNVTLTFSGDVLMGSSGRAVEAIYVGSLSPGASVSYLIKSSGLNSVTVSVSCDLCEPVEAVVEFSTDRGPGAPLWLLALLLIPAAGAGILLCRR